MLTKEEMFLNDNVTIDNISIPLCPALAILKINMEMYCEYTTIIHSSKIIMDAYCRGMQYDYESAYLANDTKLYATIGRMNVFVNNSQYQMYLP